jgi:hypothetical protein
MLLIEGAEYRQCGCCLSWRPADELVWNDELLNWVCYDTSCVSALVV